MAIMKKAVATVPAKTVSKTVARVAPKTANAPKKVAGFEVLKGIEVPTKRSFGGKRSIYNELFEQMEQGDCVEIPVEEGVKNISKMNGLYNAARRNGASITIRVHEAGEDGISGGVLRMWYNGQKEQAEA